MKYNTLFRITASGSFDVEVHNFINRKGFRYANGDKPSPSGRARINDSIYINNTNSIYYTRIQNRNYFDDINISFNILKYCIRNQKI